MPFGQDNYDTVETLEGRLRLMQETTALAAWLLDSTWDDVPSDVRHEACRAVLNYLGCAVGGSREPSVEIALTALAPFAGPSEARVIGRADRVDPLLASLLNGISAHVHDYDDTTPGNYVHPSAPVASALFAYASVTPVSGRDFLNAFTLGFEATTRVGDAVYPAHYDAGWHITGTAGVFGAAAAIGRLLCLNQKQMTWALGLASTQASGLREMFGTMGKAFHPGRAAQNGYSAALLAQAGFTSGSTAIEGPRGFAAVQASRFDLRRITDGLGVEFGLRKNTYKPFPCGIVNHPTIDGCIQLSREHDLRPERIRAVRLEVAPLVLDLCNKQGITLGLEGKFSVYHGAAVGLTRRQAGLSEYTDEAVNDPMIRRVREATTAVASPEITEDQARIEVTLEDGTRLTRFVESSPGNLRRPMTDASLETKFLDQSAGVLGERAARDAVRRCWNIETLESLDPLVALVSPGS
jgi:2-methylcitrate dehydratase PrpD